MSYYDTPISKPHSPCIFCLCGMKNCLTFPYFADCSLHASYTHAITYPHIITYPSMSHLPMIITYPLLLPIPSVPHLPIIITYPPYITYPLHAAFTHNYYPSPYFHPSLHA